MVEQKEIIVVLAKLQAYYGKELKPEIQQMYVEHLEKMEPQQFRAASVRMISEFNPSNTVPFPLIKNFLELAGMDSKTQAVNIITKLRAALEKMGQYPSVNLGDRFLHGVINRYGGWADMVMQNTDEWWSLHERNFITAYQAAKASGFTGPEYLIGVQEQTNRFDGFTPEKIIGLERGINPKDCGYLEDVKTKRIDAPKTSIPEKPKSYKNMTLREKLKALPVGVK
jgi:hypothetical protein